MKGAEMERTYKVMDYEVGLNTKTHKGTIMLNLENKAWAMIVDLPRMEFNQVMQVLNNGNAMYSESGKIVNASKVKRGFA